jgi:hypothetical protein
LYRREIKNQFIHTDFPDAVCPATSKCGILVKSQTIISPFTSFHIAIGNSSFESLNSRLAKISFKETTCLFSFGTSIQTTHSPGIGACILILFA